jgi:hypothetical protein
MTVSFSLTKLTNGTLADADVVMSNESFLLVPALNFALDGVTTTNQDGLKVDLFAGDTSQSLTHLTYNAGTDSFDTADQSGWVDYYMDIYTTSSTGISALAINNCTTQLIFDDGSAFVYRMYCSTGTAEVRRAQVMRTLFVGSGYVGSANKVSGITGLTNLKSSDSRDVGKRAYTYAINYSSGSLGGGTQNNTYDITFNNTSSNTDCSIWSAAGGMKSGGSPWYSGYVNFPTSTTINSGSSSASRLYGTDRSADELDNPADLQLSSVPFGTGTTYSGAFQNQGPNSVLILCVGTTSGVYAEYSDISSHASSTVDFTTTHSIPLIEAAVLTTEDAILVTGTAVLTSPTTGIIKTLKTIDAANSLAVEFSANGGSNYQTITEKTLFAITNTGTTGQLRFTITRTDNTTVDTINSYAYYTG